MSFEILTCQGGGNLRRHRLGDNPPNIIYSEEELSQYHFHRYSGNEIAGFSSPYSQSVDTILLGYVEEMFFSRPYEGQ
jgi:hypothetical protein